MFSRFFLSFRSKPHIQLHTCHFMPSTVSEMYVQHRLVIHFHSCFALTSKAATDANLCIVTITNIYHCYEEIKKQQINVKTVCICVRRSHPVTSGPSTIEDRSGYGTDNNHPHAMSQQKRHNSPNHNIVPSVVPLCSTYFGTGSNFFLGPNPFPVHIHIAAINTAHEKKSSPHNGEKHHQMLKMAIFISHQILILLPDLLFSSLTQASCLPPPEIHQYRSIVTIHLHT